MTENHSRLRELFIAACDLPELEQASFIDKHCSDDQPMAVQLKQLLDLDGQTAGVFSDGNTSAGIAFQLDTVVDCELPAEDVSGRYQLLREIARGGMGVIIEGRDKELGRELAFKLLLDQHKGNVQIVQRFLREAQISGQLQHPGIAPIHEVGQLLDGRPFISMKLVKGDTLAALLKARNKPTEETGKFIGIFEQVCQTLAYAHSRGVIHRDLKPANIMVGAFGEVQVMDWGLAKVLTAATTAEMAPKGAPRASDWVQPLFAISDDLNTDDSPTRVGSVMGTPAYMPPEQAMGRIDQLDRRTDVFSLGAILCEILTGQPAYVVQDNSKMVKMASTGDLKDCFQRLDASGSDPELVAIAKHCLCNEQRDRPSDAAVVSSRITNQLLSVEMRLRETEIERAAQSARADEERKRRLITLALAATILLTTIFGGIGWFVLQNQKAVGKAATLSRINKSLNDAKLHERLASTVNVETDPTLAAKIRELNLSLTSAMDAANLAESSGVDRSLQALAQEFVSDMERRTRSAIKEADLIALDNKLQRDLDLIRLTNGRGADAKQLWESADGSRTNASMIDALLRESLLSDFKNVPTLYERVFRESGLDFASQDPNDLTTRIKHSSIRESLISALDNWARVIRELHFDEETDLSDAPISAEKLLGLASRADSSEWRKELRSALAEEKVDRLYEMAADEQLQTQSNELICWLGVGLRNAKFDEASVRVLRRAQQRAPDDFWLNYELAMSLAAVEGNDMEAVGYVRAALGIRPENPGILVELGRFLSRMGRFEESILAHQRAVEIDPDFAPAVLNLGICLAAQGKFDDAIAKFRKAIQLGSTDVKANWGIAYCYFSQNNLDEAILGYEKAIELDPTNPEFYFGLGVCFDAQGDSNAAIAVYRDALKVDPGYDRAHVNLGNILRKQGKLDQAIAAYRLAIGLNTINVTARSNLGWTLCLRGKPQEAEIELREAIAIAPDLVDAHLNLGNSLGMQGKHKDAKAQFRKAIEIEPVFAKAHVQLAHALRMEGNLDEATAEVRTAIEIEPDNMEIRNGLASILLQQLEFEDAIAELRVVIQIAPEFAEAHFNLGYALVAQGEVDDAVAAYRKSVELNPLNVSYRVNLGFTLAEQGRLEPAIVELRKAIEINPNDTKALRILGDSLAENDQLEEAVSSYRMAIEIDPNNASVREALGDTLLRQDALEDAVSEYRKAVELDANESSLHVKLGSILAKQARPLKALAEFQRAIAMSPDDAVLHDAIAYRLVVSQPNDQTTDETQAVFNEGLRLAKIACELEGDNPKFTLTLGIAQYRNERWELALDSFEKSFQLNKKTDSLENLLFRAMTHWRLDEHDKSNSLFASAVQSLESLESDSIGEQQQELFEEAAKLLGKEESVEH